MNLLTKLAKNQEGFALVIALMILVILSLIGVAGISTSIFEKQIAGNDWSAKRTFYQADGSTELGSELLEYNFSCGPITATAITSRISVNTPDVFHNDTEPTQPYPDDLVRDFCWPAANCAADSTAERSNMSLFGDLAYAPGSAIQMAAGYEGRGKGAATGGAAYLHEIHAQAKGPKGDEAIVRVQWRHVVGMEDPSGCY